MDGSKSVFQSRTFWGLVVAALGPWLGKIGLSMSDADVQQAVEALVTLSGVALGIWGRVQAIQGIKIIPGGDNK